MNKQKIKAFTILEVTITMLLTALVIGITYASYTIVVKSYRSFTGHNDDLTVLTNLDHVLKRDFDQAEIIYKATDGISLKSRNNLIKYTITPEFITRSTGKTDTFKVQTQEVATLYNNIPLTEVQLKEEQNRIDEFSFNLVFPTAKIPYHYYKLYSSFNLIQRDRNAIN
jgi:hypothetical protein